jgi:rod shape-determining protein MreC
LFRSILNKYVFGFFVFVVLALVLISYTGRERTSLTPAEKVIKDLITPLENGVTVVINAVGDTVNPVFSIGSINEQNKNLKRKVSELEAENLLLKEYEYQNLRLRDLLQFKDSVSKDYEIISAAVVARNPSNSFQTVTINRGENDGIQRNMAVVTSMGLVGHVINVSRYSAEVMLIIDNESAVSSLVQITRTPGVIEGPADRNGYLKMSHISKEAPLRNKQVIISSGLGGIFPKGLPIGKIVKVEIESNGLEKYALIRPFADFNRLEEVMVIKKVFAEGLTSPSGGGNN